MNSKRNFIKKMMSNDRTPENPVAEDIFWGTLAMVTVMLAITLSGIINWWGWFLLAMGAICIFLAMEVLRFRVQLLPKYKAARRVSLFIICDCLILCIVGIIRAFLPK